MDNSQTGENIPDIEEKKLQVKKEENKEKENTNKDKLCIIERDNSPQTIKKYGQDLYYLKGWEKDMKKSFLSLEELSRDAFFDGKSLIEVWDDLRFDIS